MTRWFARVGLPLSEGRARGRRPDGRAAWRRPRRQPSRPLHRGRRRQRSSAKAIVDSTWWDDEEAERETLWARATQRWSESELLESPRRGARAGLHVEIHGAASAAAETAGMADEAHRRRSVRHGVAGGASSRAGGNGRGVGGPPLCAQVRAVRGRPLAARLSFRAPRRLLERAARPDASRTRPRRHARNAGCAAATATLPRPANTARRADRRRESSCRRRASSCARPWAAMSPSTAGCGGRSPRSCFTRDS